MSILAKLFLVASCAWTALIAWAMTAGSGSPPLESILEFWLAPIFLIGAVVWALNGFRRA